MNAWCVSLMLVLALSMPALAGDDPLAEKGMELLEANKDAIVLVKAVVEIQGGGQLAMMMGGSENERSASGVIVDEGGLVILPYNLLDITGLLGDLAARYEAEEGVKLRTDIKDIRIRLGNGSQIPARMVFKDEDLGICFVAPLEELKESDRKAIRVLSVDAEVADPGVMDQLIGVGRLSESLDFTPCLEVGRIRAVVQKPRKQYVADISPGMPVFTTEGRLAGFSVILPVGGGERGANPVILPAGEVVKLASEAKKALKKSEE